MGMTIEFDSDGFFELLRDWIRGRVLIDGIVICKIKIYFRYLTQSVL